MNENDMKNESQKYLDEMMRFYSMNKDASVSTGEAASIEPEPAESQSITEETLKQEDISEKPSEEASDIEEMPETDFEERFPEPVIPEFIRESNMSGDPGAVGEDTKRGYRRISAQRVDEESVPYTDYGFLKVEVRTADNSMPVPNAAVTVVKKGENGDELIFSGSTDESGSVKKIKLPAPPNTKRVLPESFQNYAVYTVSVYSDGYYRAVSSDVPVFGGITSIQRFNLIPIPFSYQDNGQSIVNENTEPDI